MSPLSKGGESSLLFLNFRTSVVHLVEWDAGEGQGQGLVSEGCGVLETGRTCLILAVPTWSHGGGPDELAS